MRRPGLWANPIWHAYLLLAICGLLAALWSLPASIAACLLFALDRRLWRWQRIALSALVFCTGLYLAQTDINRGHLATAHPPAWIFAKAQIVCGEIITVQGMPAKSLKIILKNTGPKGTEPLPGYTQWNWENPLRLPLPGESVCIKRQIKPVRGFANLQYDSYLTSLFAKKIYWRFWSKGETGNPAFSGEGTALARLRDQLRAKFLNILSQNSSPTANLPQAKAILPALLFGDRQYLTQTTIDLFASATLAHSLALSGQHLAIAALISLLLIFSLALVRPRIYEKKPRILLVAALTLPLAAIYLWLGNGPASLQRAGAMLAFAAIWLWLGRPFSGQDLLCGALCIILLLNPMAIFDTGLQMSALCVAVILLVWPGLAKLDRKPESPKTLWQILKKRALLILAISLAIQLALLPINLARFQIAGFWFPLNLIWLPALGLIVLPFSALGLIICLIPFDLCQNLARLAGDLAALPCEGMLQVLHWLASKGWLSERTFMLPHWGTILAFAALAIGLAWLWAGGSRNLRKSAALICIALCLLAFGPAARLCYLFTQKPQIEAIDTGQSQAILITLPGDQRLLIDGGGSFSGKFDIGKLTLAPCLSSNQRPQLTAVINTHPDQDHLGGLFHILNIFSVDYLFHNGREAQKGNQEKWGMQQAKANAYALAAGDAIFCDKQGATRLEVLHPAKDAKSEGNAASLILRLVHNGKSLALIPGDADKKSLKQINAKETQIVIAPHHGSDRNFSLAFYEACKPEAVIACCGFMNRWGYPGQKLKTWLEKKGIKFYDTAQYGGIKIIFDRDGPVINTTRNGQVK